MFEPGRVCVKVAGREAGRYCIVLKKPEGRNVLVTGPAQLTGVRRRKCNLAHLEPLLDTIKVSADASDAEVLAAWKPLQEKFNLAVAQRAKAKEKQ